MVIASSAAAAQTADPATEAQALRAQANVQVARQDVVQAEALWSRAAELLAGLQDWKGLGDVHGERALAVFNRGREDEAERWWLSGLAAYEAAGALSEQARTLRNLTFLRRLSPGERLMLARRAVDAAVVSGDPIVEGSARHQLSDQLYGAGDIAGASEHLHLAIGLLERAPESIGLARALTSAGRLHRVLGRPTESVTLNTRSALVLERLGDLAGAAQALDAVTRALIDVGGATDAIPSAAAALAMARRSGRPVPIVRSLCRMAVVLADRGRGVEGLTLLDEAAPLAAAADMTSTYLDARSTTLASVGRVAEALEAREARPAEGPLEDRIWNSYHRAALLRRLGRTAEARDELRRAVARFDELSEKLTPDDASKRGYFDRVRVLVDLHVRVLADVGEHDAALEAAERGRARAFQDLLLSRALDAWVPGAATTRMARHESEGAARPAAGVALMPLRSPSLDEVLGSGARASDRPTAPAPPAIASLVTARVPSLADVRRAAAVQQSSLLVYWVGQDDTLIWVVAPGGQITMTRSAVGEAALAVLARTAVSASGVPVRGQGGVAFDAGSRAALRRLYDVLIAPVRASLPAAADARLTIVPHGPLFRVSFAGLPNRRGRYLVEDYRLHYAPSAGALADVAARQRGGGPVLLVVDPVLTPTGDGATLPRLPAAADEGRAITRALSGHGVALLGGHDATEARVRHAMTGASVVHFATHGVVSEDAPSASYLALAGASAQPDDDGHLSAGELYDLRLDADLVMLGACRSATGPDTGDGVTGLARAFLAAGVPTVVAALWDLPDATTALMQPAFYRRWNAHASPSDALRHAQLDLLRHLRAGRVTVNTAVGALTVPEHPSMWAGLVAIGAP
jgi:CHAT domain-containing protein/tetratricopeptide (TPR) repeat protein